MLNTRKPLFWIIQVIVLVLSVCFARAYYLKAFPIVDLSIKMNRSAALQSAKDLAIQQHWGPDHFQQSASFETDEQTQTFIELGAGGKAAFTQVLNSGLYSPYTWRVRHFYEGKTNETQILFTPKGEFFGFVEKISEDTPGAALSQTEALQVAEETVKKTWKLDLRPYHLLEKSKEVKTSQRLDHVFIYERSKEKIGDGHYRLKLVVSGNRLTEMTYFIHIPEAFKRRYAEMRSSNDTIGTIASVAMFVLYIFGGCGFGIFFLARKNWILWKTPLLCAGGVAFFQFLENLNQLPLIWMHYDTALAARGFLIKNLSWALIRSLLDFLLLSVSFVAAESLSRKAFPKHPQLWRIWLPKNASTLEILGRTLGGYLSVGFFFAFVVFIYIVGTQYLGWWSPSDTLFHPDGLATYCPWFTSIANSLHAGFWEESLFRAIPLAGAALIGARLGNRRAWLSMGFVVQALIFAAAHANYPAQPSYARVVELILPSFMFGGLYIYFGLLPGIILHFTFDVICFSLPLFSAQTPGIEWDRFFVILLTLMPLWILLFIRIFRTSRWTELSRNELNESWHAPTLSPKTTHTPPSREYQAFGRGFQITLALLSLASIILVGMMFYRAPKLPRLDITRDQAIALSKKALIAKGFNASPAWKALASASMTLDEDELFIWKSEGPSTYHQLIGSYLSPPIWKVRFVRFDASVEERAEEYQVYLSEKGKIFRTRHVLPEHRPGKSVNGDQARALAKTAIQDIYSIAQSRLKEISVVPTQHDQRQDWVLTFSHTDITLKEGEARIGVRMIGNEVASTVRYIFVPEEWSRNERNRQNLIGIVKTFSGIIVLLTLLGGVVYALFSWTRKQFSKKIFRQTLLCISSIGILASLNGIPFSRAMFNTEAPLSNQMINWAAFSLLKILFFSLCSSILLGYFHFRAKDQKPTLSRTAFRIQIAIQYALGILLFAISRIVTQYVLPPLSPPQGSLEGLNVYISWMAGLPTLEAYILYTLFLMILGSILNEWRGQIFRLSSNRSMKVFLYLLFGFALSGMHTERLRDWVILGISVSFALWTTYRYFVQGVMGFIPLIVASIFLLGEVQKIFAQLYVGSLTNSLVTIFLIGILSIFWSVAWTQNLCKSPKTSRSS